MAITNESSSLSMSGDNAVGVDTNYGTVNVHSVSQIERHLGDLSSMKRALAMLDRTDLVHELPDINDKKPYKLCIQACPKDRRDLLWYRINAHLNEANDERTDGIYCEVSKIENLIALEKEVKKFNPSRNWGIFCIILKTWREFHEASELIDDYIDNNNPKKSLIFLLLYEPSLWQRTADFFLIFLRENHPEKLPKIGYDDITQWGDNMPKCWGKDILKDVHRWSEQLLNERPKLIKPGCKLYPSQVSKALNDVLKSFYNP